MAERRERTVHGAVQPTRALRVGIPSDAVLTWRAWPANRVPTGRIVEAANFGTRFEADAAIALLEANGIQASGKYGDAGGWMPHIALLDGFRVLVFDEDLDAAQGAAREPEDCLETARARAGRRGVSPAPTR